MPLYRLSQSQRRLQRQNKAFPPLRQHTRTMKTRKKKKETQTPITSIFVSVQWSRGSLLHHILKAWPCWWSFCLDCNLNNRLMSSPLEIIHIRQYCLPFSPVPRAARSKTIATGRRACTPLPPLLFFWLERQEKRKEESKKGYDRHIGIARGMSIFNGEGNLRVHHRLVRKVTSRTAVFVEHCDQRMLERTCRKPKPVGFDERVAVPIIDWGHGVPVVCMATPVLLREVQMPNESVITFVTKYGMASCIGGPGVYNHQHLFLFFSFLFSLLFSSFFFFPCWKLHICCCYRIP